MIIHNIFENLIANAIWVLLGVGLLVVKRYCNTTLFNQSGLKNIWFVAGYIIAVISFIMAIGIGFSAYAIHHGHGFALGEMYIFLVIMSVVYTSFFISTLYDLHNMAVLKGKKDAISSAQNLIDSPTLMDNTMANGIEFGPMPDGLSQRGIAEEEARRDRRKPIEQLHADVHDEINSPSRPTDGNIANANKRMVSVIVRAIISNDNAGTRMLGLTKVITVLTCVMAVIAVVQLLLLFMPHH